MSIKTTAISAANQRALKKPRFDGSFFLIFEASYHRFVCVLAIYQFLSNLP
jgi:hypothetical protein